MSNPDVQNRDDNYIVPKFGVLNTDTVQGQHLVTIKLNSNNAIMCNTTDTISFTMKPVSPRNKNYLPCWLFRGLDGKTYPAVVNSSGEVLVES
jgi:hypothetical protein